jgi:uncharacterized protein (TIGR02246 family)
MKNTFNFLSVLGFLFFVGYQPVQARIDVEAEKAQIKSVLQNYVTSIEMEDLDLYAKIMAHDPDMVNFGTSGSPVVGWEALKKLIADQNAALSETKIGVSDLKIRLSGDGKFGWATDLWTFQAKMGEKAITLPVRCTWILEKRGDAWTIVHFHKSEAVS